jgi:hypothetical protein
MIYLEKAHAPWCNTPSQERFGLSISVSQLNCVRASLGLSRHRMPREKNKGGNRTTPTLVSGDGKCRILLTEPTSAESDDALAQVGFLM